MHVAASTAIILPCLYVGETKALGEVARGKWAGRVEVEGPELKLGHYGGVREETCHLLPVWTLRPAPRPVLGFQTLIPYSSYEAWDT